MESIFKWLISGKTIAAIAAIAVAIVLHFIIRKIEKRYKAREKSQGEMATVIRVSFGIVNFLILLFMIFIILRIYGININSIVAGLGIASAIIGLALQDLLKDVIMGINILADHYYVVGECVEYLEKECIVVGFSLRSTKLEDLSDHSIITVSNRNITQIKRLGNRMVLFFNLAYDENRTKIDEISKVVCRNLESRDEIENCIFNGIYSFESSSIKYKITVICEPKNRPTVLYIVNREIVDTFEANGVKMPYNKLDVFVRSEGK